MLIIRYADLNAKDAISNYKASSFSRSGRILARPPGLIRLLFGSLHYIALYPILTFHATRVLDFKDRKGTLSALWPQPLRAWGSFRIRGLCRSLA